MTTVTELCTKEPALRALVIQAELKDYLDGSYADYGSAKDSLERLYNLAYKAGEKAMQERAAKAYEDEADTWKAWPQAGAAKRKGSDAIRALVLIGETNNE